LLLMWWGTGLPVAVGSAYGLVVFYLNYEEVHGLSHCTRETLELRYPGMDEPSVRLRAMVEWHKRHHDAWGVNYGVTTPFWDLVSGTAAAKDQRELLNRIYLPTTRCGLLGYVVPVYARLIPQGRDTPIELPDRGTARTCVESQAVHDEPGTNSEHT